MERPKLSEYIIMVTLFASLCAVWYFAYVRPADASRMYIMDCMEEYGDVTLTGYQHCGRKLQER